MYLDYQQGYTYKKPGKEFHWMTAKVMPTYPTIHTNQFLGKMLVSVFDSYYNICSIKSTCFVFIQVHFFAKN